MKNIVALLMFISPLQELTAQSSFDQYPVYNGSDLGLSYSKTNSLFRIWSPPAEQALLLFYKDGEGGAPTHIIDLKKGSTGTWFAKLNGDLKGSFYVFKVKIFEK